MVGSFICLFIFTRLYLLTGFIFCFFFGFVCVVCVCLISNLKHSVCHIAKRAQQNKFLQVIFSYFVVCFQYHNSSSNVMGVTNSYYIYKCVWIKKYVFMRTRICNVMLLGRKKKTFFLCVSHIIRLTLFAMLTFHIP